MVHSSILGVIGGTPMIELTRFSPRAAGRILLKLDYLNPGASRKDRVALRMVEDAERNGQLQPGQTVVELTSGNTGTGLAIVCAVKGYRFVAVMSAGNSPERARMMRALGAEVVLVPQAEGGMPGQVSGADLDLVEARAGTLTVERGAFRADQFSLPAKIACHVEGTAEEILADTGGRFDAFCDFVGSGGGFVGAARRFRAHDPHIACYVVEPAGAAVLGGGELTRSGHKIQGGGYARADLVGFDDAAVSGYITVSDDEAIDAARALAKSEGVFAGFSTGANLAAAAKILNRHHPGGVVVTTACDSGLKYFSTDLWPA